MPHPPTVSPVTGDPVPPHYVHASSSHFRDSYGRTLLLRGVNICGSAKTPTNQPGWKLEGFWEGAEWPIRGTSTASIPTRRRTGELGNGNGDRKENNNNTGAGDDVGPISFVNRVFDLGDLEGTERHLKRLREWGFVSVRYIFTWESIEHEGPGKYDMDFIDYTVRMLRKIKEFGFKVFMDPHQDLFSRFSGGDGCPLWVLHACGMNPRNFTATNAAAIECEWPNPSNPDPASFPKMIWASNYTRLACQTLNTLFFAGRDFAPKCIIDGVNIQDWLHSRYFAACRKLAEAIRDDGTLLDECVIGWDSWNEPNRGLVEEEDLEVLAKRVVLRVGPMPTPFQAMRLGMGEAVKVEKWKFSPLGAVKDGNLLINPEGQTAWLDPSAEPNGISPWGWQRDPGWRLGECIWAQHGVWDTSTKQLLQRDYFYHRPDMGPGDHAEYGRDYWLKHFTNWGKTIREIHREAILFAHPPVFEIPPVFDEAAMEVLNHRACFSSHFYDGLTLITKHWNFFNADATAVLRGKLSLPLAIRIGEKAIRQCFRDQLGVIRQDTFYAMGRYPTMIGEIGIPYDLDNKKAYQDGDYSAQTRAMDASLNSCDGSNCHNYSIWCYDPENVHKWGDLWNGEDLSIFSTDDARLIGRYKNSLRSGGSTTAFNTPVMSPEATPYISSSQLRQMGGPSSTSLNGLLKSSNDSSRADLNGGREWDDAEIHRFLSLNDGGRALSAVARPFPIATVGTPVEINFDIKSSVFTFSVVVHADDIATSEDLPTTIFVPRVHYAAHPKDVSPEVRQDSNGGTVEPTSRRFRRKKRENSNMSNKPFGNPGMNRSAMSLTSIDEDAELDLDVEVTSGVWDIEGQTLMWYYPRPQLGSPPVKETIKIKRASGPIATWARSYGEAYGGMSSPSTAEAAIQVCARSFKKHPVLTVVGGAFAFTALGILIL